ncbi:MAG: DNA polymerase III subunit gamma/tau [Deltaproteobacteria bacterium]|nr:DNA polymerase III subunit gamma/tau [Deltaproteobacteria bacterium]MBW2116409.1 DNA polymerase III subunit gamma/tau [Deltaproteobacteria bacterium]MBW2344726.1 DNA polymerase III subunit gamma/tau [Deltaproteobacteria bacterium]
MAYEVLARKWRPQVFEDVIGQEHITKTLINAIKSGRLSHAYLFSGPRGVGKTTVARILAKAINCEKGEPGIPCNECPSCTEITNGSSVDVQEIDGASNRGIDEIRELRESTKYMPASSKYRIYIIDEVHMLTKEAFNALLKTLEEPPAHVKFIFATTESHKVPVTILSRCQRFDFKRISPARIIDHLEKMTQREGVECSRTGLALIAKQAEGSMRDAQSLLDQVISFTGSKVEDGNITEVLGIIDRDIIFETSRAIIEGEPKKCLEIVDQIYNYGSDIKEFYRALMDQFRNLMIILIASREYLLDMTESEKEEAARQAGIAGSEKLQVLLNFMISREADLRFTSHPRLILETTVIKLCHLGEFLSFDDLLRKIESLEKRLTGSPDAGRQPMAAQIAESSADWVSEKAGKRASQEESTAKSGQSWDDFLTFLQSKSKATYNILKDWQLIKLNEKIIEIARSSQSFSSTYFDDPERYKELEDYCRDFFKTDIRVKIVNNNQPKPSKSSASQAKDHSDLPPPVQEIVHMFQGEIAANKKGGVKK